MSYLSFAETKSTCYLAYDGNKGESYKFPDGSVWMIIDAWATRISGFKAILIRPSSERNLMVLSFAGTDSLRDVVADGAQVLGVKPVQYYQALILTNVCNSAFGESLHLTGHSLGGGLAAYSSVETKLFASTINPAPLVAAASFSALFGNNSQITNYIAGGSEFVSSSPGRNPGRDVAVPAKGNFFTRHSLANTAPSVPLPTKI